MKITSYHNQNFVLKHHLVVYIVLLFIASSWASDSTKTTYNWKNGETLRYEIGWGFIPAGKAFLQTVPKENNQLLFRTRATNSGNFTGIYKVRDTIDTWVNRNTLLPSVFSKIINEGGWHSRTHINFDQENLVASLKDSVLDISKRNGSEVKRSSDTTVNIEPNTHCIISAFYLIRTMDLKPGKEYYFKAVDGKKKYDMKVICHKYEKIETEYGEYECIKVEPMLQGDGIFKSKGKLYVWFTNDEKKLPLKMKSKISVGSVYADLIAVE